ncbi:hypothetical protein ACOTHZ_12745 [Achromobacter xylosoxidans]
MSNASGALSFFNATAGAIRRHGRAMLAAAPWSLAVFLLSLPFAILAASLYWLKGGLFLLFALVNLIAFSRMTYAWHRVIARADDTRIDAGGSTAQAWHLVMLGLLAVVVTTLARATGDLPYVLFTLMNGPDSGLFFAALVPVVLVLWLPILYGLALLAPALPRAAITGATGLRGVRAAMPYPRWPLMLALGILVSAGGLAHSALYEYLGYALDGGPYWIVAYLTLFIVMTFVVGAMVSVAYRDGAPARPASHSDGIKDTATP